MPTTERTPPIPYEWPVGTDPRMKRHIIRIARQRRPNGTSYELSRWMQRHAWTIIRQKESGIRRTRGWD